MDSTYLSHINCGAVIVPRGEEMALVNITSGISGSGRDQDWNCQNFVVEGLEEIVNQEFQTKEWLEFIMEEFMDKVVGWISGRIVNRILGWKIASYQSFIVDSRTRLSDILQYITIYCKSFRNAVKAIIVPPL